MGSLRRSRSLPVPNCPPQRQRLRTVLPLSLRLPDRSRPRSGPPSPPDATPRPAQAEADGKDPTAVREAFDRAIKELNKMTSQKAIKIVPIGMTLAARDLALTLGLKGLLSAEGRLPPPMPSALSTPQPPLPPNPLVLRGIPGGALSWRSVVPQGAYRALCTRCARAVRKVGCSPPPGVR